MRSKDFIIAFTIFAVVVIASSFIWRDIGRSEGAVEERNFFRDLLIDTIGTQPGSLTKTTVPQTISGDYPDAATLTLNAYVGSHGEEGARTEKYPVYTILKHSNGGKITIVNDAVANSTTGIVEGDTVDIYCTGASYYCDPVLNYRVKGVSDTVEIKAYSVAATSDLVIKAYDEDENALTADDNANNTADYAGGDVAATDMQEYYVKISQTGANKNFWLFGICTYMVGDEADDIELVDSNWKKVSVPDKLDSATITHYDDINTSTAEKGFRKCYEPKDGKPIRMTENKDTGKLKFVFDSDDTTQPTANGDTYFGVSIVDGSYSVDKDGNINFGFYMDDDTEDPAGVGIDESVDTTFNGLDVAVAIEPQ